MLKRKHEIVNVKRREGKKKKAYSRHVYHGDADFENVSIYLQLSFDHTKSVVLFDWNLINNKYRFKNLNYVKFYTIVNVIYIQA